MGKGARSEVIGAAVRREVPFGWWPSPSTAAEVAAGKVSRGTLQVDGTVAYWTESRPDESGRQVVVAGAPAQGPTDASPGGVSVRTRVHEYGGAAFGVRDGVLYYSDGDDERLYRLDPGGDGVALTPPAPPDAVVRFADFRLTPSKRWLLAVEERIAAGRTDHRLVAVATDASGLVLPLVEDADFVAAPRPSPDGSLLAYTCWDHPAMPWDAAELRVGELTDGGDAGISLRGSRRVSGGAGGSVGQPRWCADGSLLFADEGTGWWLPVRLSPADLRRRLSDRGREEEPVRPLVESGAEFHGPDWVLGQSTMDELPDGSIVARRRRTGRDDLVRLVPPAGSTGDRAIPWSIEVLEQPCVSLAGVATAEDGSVWVLGSTPSDAYEVLELAAVEQRPDGGGGPGHLRRRIPAGLGRDPAMVAEAEPYVAPGPGGDVPGLFFDPVSPTTTGPEGERPPLVVFCHGGPTAAAEPGFDPVVQFFTSRGFAVAVVDYRGSTGYGRAYRNQLTGAWGEADVEDCIAFARGLAAAGRVDGDRMSIRGTSAGGLTALSALVRSREFRGAASWYGVTDLGALARDTHDFESRYLDGLVGPWPEEAARFAARSPLHHAAEVSGSVLLLQGADDRVVPRDQAERFAAELESHGTPCRLVVFPGEAHGFRRAETIEACLEEELAFYRRLFGEVG